VIGEVVARLATRAVLSSIIEPVVEHRLGLGWLEVEDQVVQPQDASWPQQACYPVERDSPSRSWGSWCKALWVKTASAARPVCS
jgi:hypothetical protein